VAVGRGAYGAAIELQHIIGRCRKRTSTLFGAESPDRIIFTFNGTDSLNLALHGLLGPGDHVVTSVLEHNSVLRPLRDLRDRLGVEVTSVSANAAGQVEPAECRRALRPETKLIALVHVSNVTGALQPIADVGEIARDAGVLFLVDAAQSAGHVPIDLANLPVDLLACPGHKGLLGPLGTGLLYIRPGVEEQLHSVRQGGTGSQSEDDHQPDVLPDKYESGNHNAPGLCGLEASLGYLQSLAVEHTLDAPAAVESIQRHEHDLIARLMVGLSAVNGVHIHGPAAAEDRVGVASITIDGFEPHVAATILDENFGIQTRAGLHCAPGVHRALGTFEGGGTVRFSVGAFTTPKDIDAAIAAVGDIAASG
jgi:cysteine desulfurase family protein